MNTIRDQILSQCILNCPSKLDQHAVRSEHFCKVSDVWNKQQHVHYQDNSENNQGGVVRNGFKGVLYYLDTCITIKMSKDFSLDVQIQLGSLLS